MTPLESLRAELHAEIDRRIDAVEKKAHKAKLEWVIPPAMADGRICALLEGYFTTDDAIRAGQRLRYVEAELERLREGLKRHDDDCASNIITAWAEVGTCIPIEPTLAPRMAHEITRHRALVTK